MHHRGQDLQCQRPQVAGPLLDLPGRQSVASLFQRLGHLHLCAPRRGRLQAHAVKRFLIVSQADLDIGPDVVDWRAIDFAIRLNQRVHKGRIENVHPGVIVRRVAVGLGQVVVHRHCPTVLDREIVRAPHQVGRRACRRSGGQPGEIILAARALFVYDLCAGVLLVIALSEDARRIHDDGIFGRTAGPFGRRVTAANPNAYRDAVDIGHCLA